LHSLLPHQHFDELDSEEHKEEHAQADGLIDYLQLIFHTDLGDGHMESFEDGKGFDFDVDFTINLIPVLVAHSYYPLLQNPSNHQSIVSYYDHDIPILKKDVIAHLDFRGPPSFV
jgi:hypothetical protein